MNITHKYPDPSQFKQGGGDGFADMLKPIPLH